ncbi:MAG: LmeA family phospholipid-binding protein [Micropruina sp.]
MRKLLGLVLVVALLAGGLVGAEWSARQFVTGKIGQGLEASLGVTEPRVRISQAPLLWDLVNRRISAVRVETDALPMVVTSHNVTFTGVEFDATDIALRGSDAVLGRLEGQALLDYAQLSAVAGLPVEPADDGRFGVTYSFEVFGQPLTATLTGAPEVDVPAQTISLTEPSVQLAGVELPEEVVTPILLRLVTPMPITLERGLTLQSVSALNEGFRMRILGENVSVPIG